MARPKKVIEIEKREGSWTKLEIVIFAVVVALVGFIIWALAYRTDATATILDNNAQDTCPEGDGWVKVDNLDGLTYTYDVAEGFEVTDNCYKHATYVHYGIGDTVTADEHCKWEWAGKKLKYVCKTNKSADV